MRPAAGDGTLTPGRLSFGLGSTLYVGQAGAEHGGAFEGVLQELKIRRRPAGVDGEVTDLDGVCAPAADLDEPGESLDESEAPKSSAEEDLKSTVFDVAGLSGLSHEDVSGALPFNVRRQTSVNFLFFSPPQIVRMRANLKGDRGPMGPRVSERSDGVRYAKSRVRLEIIRLNVSYARI